MVAPDRTARARREYDAYASLYDRETDWYDRIMLADGRWWACTQARGRVLEVAVGTGRNLPYYPADVRLVGVDLSSGMLDVARRRRAECRAEVQLVHGDAQVLPFTAAAFDTVVCTLGLSSVPDDRAVIAEMHRVLCVGGRLVLLGHVASPYAPARVLQWVIERTASTRATDAQTRQVVPLLVQAGFSVISRRRSRAGIIERVVAAKPGHA